MVMDLQVMTNWGTVIRKLREDRGMIIKELAQKSGVTESHLGRIERGDYKGFRKETIVKLAKGLKLTPLQLFSAIYNETSNIPEPTELEVARLPLLGSVPAGYPFPEVEEKGEYIEVPRAELGNADIKNLFCLKVSGNSLIGDGINSGDVIVIERNTPIIKGKIYVIRIGNEVVTRHVLPQDDHLLLLSSNGDYREMKVTDVQVIGRVILSMDVKRH